MSLLPCTCLERDFAVVDLVIDLFVYDMFRTKKGLGCSMTIVFVVVLLLHAGSFFMSAFALDFALELIENIYIYIYIMNFLFMFSEVSLTFLKGFMRLPSP